MHRFWIYVIVTSLGQTKSFQISLNVDNQIFTSDRETSSLPLNQFHWLSQTLKLEQKFGYSKTQSRLMLFIPFINLFNNLNDRLHRIHWIEKNGDRFLSMCSWVILLSIHSLIIVSNLFYRWNAWKWCSIIVIMRSIHCNEHATTHYNKRSIDVRARTWAHMLRSHAPKPFIKQQQKKKKNNCNKTIITCLLQCHVLLLLLFFSLLNKIRLDDNIISMQLISLIFHILSSIERWPCTAQAMRR